METQSSLQKGLFHILVFKFVFVHFNARAVLNAHNPNVHVSTIPMLHACMHVCSCSSPCKYLSVKKLQQIHMRLVNADDNIPKAIKTTNNTIAVRFLNGVFNE